MWSKIEASFISHSVSVFLILHCLAHLYKRLKGTKGTFMNLIYRKLAWRTSCVCKANVCNPLIPHFWLLSWTTTVCVKLQPENCADSKAIYKLGLGKAKGVQYIAAEHCFPDRKLYTPFCQTRSCVMFARILSGHRQRAGTSCAHCSKRAATLEKMALEKLHSA